MVFVTACSSSDENAVSGVEYIKETTGEIEIAKTVSENSIASDVNTSSELMSESSEWINSTESQTTSTNETTVSDNTSSSVVNTQESKAPENQNSTTSQSSVTSGTTAPDNTSADTSSSAESNQEHELSSSNSESEPEIPSHTSTEMSETSSTDTVNDREPEQTTNKEENTLSIEITVNGRTFSATLYDNETAKAFKERLPIVLDMSELNGNEKYYYLPDDLPRNSSKPSRINTGDIMLYGSDCLVIFYESFSTSYSYTPIGKIDDPDGLAAALGSGSVQVTFN